jgi:hypothetical protein
MFNMHFPGAKESDNATQIIDSLRTVGMFMSRESKGSGFEREGLK